VKPGLLIAAAFLFLLGVVWTLQGANIIEGSFMTGQTTWLFAGVICLIASAALTWFGSGHSRRGR
jgi:hypothetical protein